MRSRKTKSSRKSRTLVQKEQPVFPDSFRTGGKDEKIFALADRLMFVLVSDYSLAKEPEFEPFYLNFLDVFDVTLKYMDQIAACCSEYDEEERELNRKKLYATMLQELLTPGFKEKALDLLDRVIRRKQKSQGEDISELMYLKKLLANATDEIWAHSALAQAILAKTMQQVFQLVDLRKKEQLTLEDVTAVMDDAGLTEENLQNCPGLMASVRERMQNVIGDVMSEMFTKRISLGVFTDEDIYALSEYIEQRKTEYGDLFDDKIIEEQGTIEEEKVVKFIEVIKDFLADYLERSHLNRMQEVVEQHLQEDTSVDVRIFLKTIQGDIDCYLDTIDSEQKDDEALTMFAMLMHLEIKRFVEEGNLQEELA